MLNKNVTERFFISQQGSRQSGNWCPHNKAFPACVSTLRAVMGLEQRARMEGEWLNDYDYFFQMGVSAEGFGLCYGMEDILKAGLWENEALADSLLSDGFTYRLAADKRIPFKDEVLDVDSIKEKVVNHLLSDRPVILIGKYSFLGIGFGDYGETLFVPSFGRGKSFAKNLCSPRALQNWTDNLNAVVFIEGLTEPIDRKAVIVRTLRRGYEMLTASGKVVGEYGYGNAMWEKWIHRFEDDSKFTKPSHEYRYIDPEKFDLAERRAYAGRFFEEAEEYFGVDCLLAARQAFDKIHYKMWDIHSLTKDENKGRLLQRETREKVIEILRECRAFDLDAAENIRQVLEIIEQQEPVKFDHHVQVVGVDGQVRNDTYLRRAKGLVKNERAEWVDDKTIRMVDESVIPEKTDETIVHALNSGKTFKYHCQHQAESFARGIVSVPVEYPLQAGLPQDFPASFSRLCEIAKTVYTDMAEQPEAYGLMLVDIASQDTNIARESYRTLHRFCDLLANLSRCGSLENHQLIVDVEAFRQSVKKGTGLVSGPVPKYELFFTQLIDFGFVISGFSGVPFNKKVESFTVEYPDCPKVIDAMKIYCDCWRISQKEGVKIWPKEFHHHFYRFDYKITADREKIPMMQWIKDEADYFGYTPEQKAFAVMFYEYSLRYRDVKFDGDYTLKGKRIARIHTEGYIAMGNAQVYLHIRLRELNKYMLEIEGLPDELREMFAKDSCQHCRYQGATEEQCKFRIHWSFDGEAHEGCSHACFYFSEFALEYVPMYWRLMEMEYGLKTQEQ